jgi:hypothetical protein
MISGPDRLTSSPSLASQYVHVVVMGMQRCQVSHATKISTLSRPARTIRLRSTHEQMAALADVVSCFVVHKKCI